MFKSLCLSLVIPVLFSVNTFISSFNQADMLQFTNNGEIIQMTNKDLEKFNEIFSSSLENSRSMPAFGVSLHEETIKAMKEGIWVKFIFNETRIENRMPFDELLIHVEKDNYGLNIIRGNNGKYEGRCFYLDLDKNLNELYNFLSSFANFNKNETIEDTFFNSQENHEKEDNKNIVIDINSNNAKIQDNLLNCIKL